MKQAGVTVSQVHARNDNHTMFRDFKVDLPGVNEFTAEQVSIPVGWWLTEKDLQTVINAVVEYDHNYSRKIREITAKAPKYEKTPTCQLNL